PRAVSPVGTSMLKLKERLRSWVSCKRKRFSKVISPKLVFPGSVPFDSSVSATGAMTPKSQRRVMGDSNRTSAVLKFWPPLLARVKVSKPTTWRLKKASGTPIQPCLTEPPLPSGGAIQGSNQPSRRLSIVNGVHGFQFDLPNTDWHTVPRQPKVG